MVTSFLNHGLALIAGILLLAAGSSKLAAPGSVQRTVIELGFSRASSAVLAAGLGLAELAVASTLLLNDGRVPRLATLALGICFAAAGARALVLDKRIECGCLQGLTGSLGWAQIAMLPFWVAVGSGPSRPGQSGETSISTRYMLFVAAAVAVAAWRCFFLAPRLVAMGRLRYSLGAPQ